MSLRNLLENHELIDSMDKEEVKIMNNIVQFYPNHLNNEQEHFSFQLQSPKIPKLHFPFPQILINLLSQ